ncbi:MAG TPA: hypothetical protein VGC76_02865 [Pyrinomonadaceae bacterium]|jgi:hypothetical protein
MKKPNFFHIKFVFTFVWIILLTIAPISERANASADMGAPPIRELQKMVKTVLMDFNEAVQNGDFSDFYSKICAPWKKQISAKEFEETFKEFIDKKIDISDIDSLDAVFSQKPSIRKEAGFSTLVLQGFYKTNPNRTKFVLHFIDDGGWKLSRIEVDTTPDK